MKSEIKEYGDQMFDDGDMYGSYTTAKYSDEYHTSVHCYFRSRPKYNNRFMMITSEQPKLTEMQKEIYRKFEIHTKTAN